MGRTDSGTYEVISREIMQLPFKLLILDFDGVIVESVGIKDEAFEQLFLGYPAHLSQIIKYHLANNATIRFEKFKYITETILKEPYTKEKEKELSASFSQLIFQRIVQCPFVKGAKTFLDFFMRQVPLYLVSMSPKEELEQILQIRQLDTYFKKVYASPWSKPDAIRDILQNERVRCQDAIFVGDTPEDYLAAKATGLFFIGRFSGKTFPVNEIPVFHDLLEIKKFMATATSFPCPQNRENL